MRYFSYSKYNALKRAKTEEAQKVNTEILKQNKGNKWQSEKSKWQEINEKVMRNVQKVPS